MPLISSDQERSLLETCLTEAKRRLDHYRELGNELLVATTEADINRILEELAHIYKRPFGRPPLK